MSKSKSSRIEEISNKHLEAYLSAIRDKYAAVGTEERLKILLGLERIVNNESLTGDFNSEIARQIRKRANISITELAKRIQVPATTISFYESRKTDFSRRRSGNESRNKYLNWLKENGYNQFGTETVISFQNILKVK